MSQRVGTSGSLALARRPRDPARLLPQASTDRRAVNKPSALSRPAQPAEIAQARVFEELLQTERAELQDLAHRITTAVGHSLDAENSADLGQTRARIEEIHCLLQALQGRFPHSQPGGDR